MNLTSETPNGTTVANVTDEPEPIERYHICQQILYLEVGKTGIRIWDIMILVPNVLFFLFLLVRFSRTKQRLKTSAAPVSTTFYVLVCISVSTSIVRCILSMSVNAATNLGGEADQICWVVVRFFLLSTEISVLVFALFFGHLESRKSIQRVLLVTCFISFAYSISQGTLELIAPDERFYIHEKSIHLFSHGGMVFWFFTCLIFGLVYFTIFALPWTPCGDQIHLPAKRSFYVYTFTLSMVNLLQALGSGLYYNLDDNGLCVVDVTTYLYFTAFTPLVYWTFLAGFFSSTKSNILFSYKPQIDDHDDAVVGPSAVVNDQLPHQLSCSSIRTDNSDFIYQQPSHLPGSSSGKHGKVYESSSFSPDSIESYRT